MDHTPPCHTKPRRGPVGPRLRWVLRHPTCVTYALLAALLGFYLLAGAWDHPELMLAMRTP